jgi:Tfp pilus assembly protein FimT
MIVVAIVGVIAAIAIPSLTKNNSLAEMRTQVRKMRGQVARARTLASTGKNENYAGWNPTDRTQQAGILITSATSYQVFVDRDNVTDGDEIVLKVVNFANLSTDADYAQQLTITTNANPPEVRFRKNGTVFGNTDIDIVFTDADSGLTETIRVLYGGTTEVL